MTLQEKRLRRIHPCYPVMEGAYSKGIIVMRVEYVITYVMMALLCMSMCLCTNAIDHWWVCLCKFSAHSMPNMTGRPGHRTMEMNGGSSSPYLACTPCFPLFCAFFNRGGNRRAFRLPGAGGGSFPLYGGTFARSYSVSTNVPLDR